MHGLSKDVALSTLWHYCINTMCADMCIITPGIINSNLSIRLLHGTFVAHVHVHCILFTILV